MSIVPPLGQDAYLLNNGDGVTELNPVMVIPVLANSIDSDIEAMSYGGVERL